MASKFGVELNVEPMQSHDAYKPSQLELEINTEWDEMDMQTTSPLKDMEYPDKGVSLLHEAAEAISTSRNETHGSKNKCFRAMSIIDDLFTEMTTDQIEQKPELSAARMIGYKLARILAGQSDFKDHWLDIAGYAGCGWECIAGEEKKENYIATDAKSDSAYGV